MPHIARQISANGPILDVVIGVSKPRMAALNQAGFPAPSPLPVRALIDTGATCSAIDPFVLNTLGLSPTGSTQVLTPSTGTTPHVCNLYDVAVYLAHPEYTYEFASVPVTETVLANQGFHALLGRDILGKCLFVYDGVTGIFTLAH